MKVLQSYRVKVVYGADAGHFVRASKMWPIRRRSSARIGTFGKRAAIKYQVIGGVGVLIAGHFVSQQNVANPAAFERANYMKVLQSYQVKSSC